MSHRHHRSPDFRQLEAVLQRSVPTRATIFEFFLNEPLITRLTGKSAASAHGDLNISLRLAQAFAQVGCDYVTLMCPWIFPFTDQRGKKETISLNDSIHIIDRESFDAYPWPDPQNYDYRYLHDLESLLPKGMKALMCGPDGVLETAIALVGYENLCLMLYEDPELIEDIFAKIGDIILQFYRAILPYPSVAGIISSDDWGFNSQTFLSPTDLRRLVFPWHKQYSALCHSCGKYAILHSCGAFDAIIDDVIDDMKFDARHSYEDNIVPVEDAYERLCPRIAVLGGIDVDFLARRSPEQIRARSAKMLEHSASRGGYALGSGNSIPAYIPDDHFFAMIDAALEL